MRDTHALEILQMTLLTIEEQCGYVEDARACQLTTDAQIITEESCGRCTRLPTGTPNARLRRGARAMSRHARRIECTRPVAVGQPTQSDTTQAQLVSQVQRKVKTPGMKINRVLEPPPVL
jgi:hypothetical protein